MQCPGGQNLTVSYMPDAVIRMPLTILHEDEHGDDIEPVAELPEAPAATAAAKVEEENYWSVGVATCVDMKSHDDAFQFSLVLDRTRPSVSLVPLFPSSRCCLRAIARATSAYLSAAQPRAVQSDGLRQC